MTCVSMPNPWSVHYHRLISSHQLAHPSTSSPGPCGRIGASALSHVAVVPVSAFASVWAENRATRDAMKALLLIRNHVWSSSAQSGGVAGPSGRHALTVARPAFKSASASVLAAVKRVSRATHPSRDHVAMMPPIRKDACTHHGTFPKRYQFQTISWSSHCWTTWQTPRFATGWLVVTMASTALFSHTHMASNGQATP